LKNPKGYFQISPTITGAMRDDNMKKKLATIKRPNFASSIASRTHQ
jgi:hypothetical protein